MSYYCEIRVISSNSFEFNYYSSFQSNLIITSQVLLGNEIELTGLEKKVNFDNTPQIGPILMF